MSIHDKVFEHLMTEMAHRAAADPLPQEGFQAAARVLDQMVSAAYHPHQAAVAQCAIEREEQHLERIAQRWARASSRPKPLRNLREKSFVHQSPLKSEPDDAWLVEHIRVPFRFYRDGTGHLFFTSRCPREAVAVKMRWG